jgi:stalled ribosome alternative rescue factor ArfA
MKQTGQVDWSRAIQVRVGKNINATYSANTSYNRKTKIILEKIWEKSSQFFTSVL